MFLHVHSTAVTVGLITHIAVMLYSRISLLQVMRCVREARQTAITREVDTRNIQTVPPAYAQEVDTSALRVKSWLPGSYARLDEGLP